MNGEHDDVGRLVDRSSRAWHPSQGNGRLQAASPGPLFAGSRGTGQTASRGSMGIAALGMLTLALWVGVSCATGDDGVEGSGGASTTTSGTGATGLSPTGGGGQGATTTTTTTTTTAAGGSVPEDCLNGVDDDGDTLVDCADSECQAAGFECVPSFSSEVQFVGLFDSGPCPDGSTSLELRSCDGCTCTADPGTCNVSVELCNAGCGSCDAALTTPTCRDVANATHSVQGTITPRNDDSCVEGPPTSPTNLLTACALPAPGSCPSGLHCVPPSLAAANERCVLLDGEGSCPGAYSASRVVFPEQATTCACSCTWGDQSCVPVSAIVSHDTGDCTGSTQAIELDGSCTAAGTVDSIEVPQVTAVVQCDRTAVPAGNVTERTLCCLP